MVGAETVMLVLENLRFLVAKGGFLENCLTYTRIRTPLLPRTFYMASCGCHKLRSCIAFLSQYPIQGCRIVCSFYFGLSPAFSMVLHCCIGAFHAFRRSNHMVSCVAAVEGALNCVVSTQYLNRVVSAHYLPAASVAVAWALAPLSLVVQVEQGSWVPSMVPMTHHALVSGAPAVPLFAPSQ